MAQPLAERLRPRTLDDYIGQKHLVGENAVLRKMIEAGRIPAMYLSDDPDSDLFDYVQLYLNEEIQAEGLVRNLPSFERFLEVAALSNSEMLNYENISKDVGVSRSAVISWFQILYDTLIAFEVPAYTKTKKRKAYTSSKFYMFDIGVIRHLLGFDLRVN